MKYQAKIGSVRLEIRFKQIHVATFILDKSNMSEACIVVFNDSVSASVEYEFLQPGAGEILIKSALEAKSAWNSKLNVQPNTWSAMLDIWCCSHSGTWLWRTLNSGQLLAVDLLKYISSSKALGYNYIVQSWKIIWRRKRAVLWPLPLSYLRKHWGSKYVWLHFHHQMLMISYMCFLIFSSDFVSKLVVNIIAMGLPCKVWTTRCVV